MLLPPPSLSSLLKTWLQTGYMDATLNPEPCSVNVRSWQASNFRGKHKKRWEQGDGNCCLVCLIPQEIKFEIIEVLQPNSWMMGMEFTWYESNLHVAFAEMSLRNATEFQRCHGCCGYSAQDVIGTAFFSFRINCVLIPEINCSPFHLLQNRPSVPQQGSMSVRVLSQVWLVGPCQHHWNVTSHFCLLTSPHRKWQLVGPGSDRSGQV